MLLEPYLSLLTVAKIFCLIFDIEYEKKKIIFEGLQIRVEIEQIQI